jgi:signal transduction histidine kinase
MTNGYNPADPRWHRLLGLAVHEFRTPVTVVAGYIRMLLTNRAGELTEQQRKLLQEAEKSCGRLSGLITEMSDLASLEAGTASFNKSSVDVSALMAESIAALLPLPDRDITIAFQNDAPGITVSADSTRLRTAFFAVLTALRRELVTSTELMVRMRRETFEGQPVVWITVADKDHVDAVDRSQPSELGTFNEWRGGCGLTLAVARRIVSAHDGRLWSPTDDPKAGAVLILPANA